MAWGEVPMVVKDEINYNMPLATVPEIYELIVSDLKRQKQWSLPIILKIPMQGMG